MHVTRTTHTTTMQQSSVRILMTCLIWIDFVSLFCYVSIVTAITSSSESELMFPANRTHFHPAYDVFQVEIGEKNTENAIKTSISGFTNSHNHNHQHDYHVKKMNRWSDYHFADFDNHRHQHKSKYEWVKHRSNESKPKFRRRHEKRWNRNHHQFIGHTDQIRSNLHADLEIQSAKMLVTANDTQSVPIHWPVKKEAIMEGDVILGGLMMVHSREDLMMCGQIMPQGGIQALEAMLYTLDKINEDLRLLPNITIGAHILDDCDRDSYGLEMAVDFIKGMSINIQTTTIHSID